MTAKPHIPRPCPVCYGHAFDSVGPYDFSDWHDTRAQNISRDHFTYDILSCQTCGHIQADHPCGDDFISGLYHRPQGTDCWSNDPDHDPLDLYRDMISFAKVHLPDSGIIADCGAGNGQILSLLRHEHGLGAKRLLGIDFSNYMDNDLPFHALDLNRVNEGAMPTVAFIFCTHLLEHVFDPRTFLRGLNKHALTGAKLYLETPDISQLNEAVLKYSNLFNSQHLHQFSLDNLARLAESTGWRVLAKESLITGFVPRARLMAEKIDTKPAADSARTVLNNLRENSDKLRQCIEKHLTQGKVALWGVGGDLMAVLESNKTFKAHLMTEKLQLFDQALAGKNISNISIHSSSTLGMFEGVIIMTPRPSKTKEPMRRYAAHASFDDRLIDPYEADHNQ